MISKWRSPNRKTQRLLCFKFCFYSSVFLCLLLLLTYGCSKVGPPDDYYRHVLDMEKQGEQIRQDTGRRPGEGVAPTTDTKPIKAPKTSAEQEKPYGPQQQTEETPVVEQEEEIQERSPQREIIQGSPPPKSTQVSIAVGSDVIKSALSATDLEVNVRTIELVNGRLSGGKNSVRVYFIPESLDVIDGRFDKICAVLYYLDVETQTVDAVAGIAEDKQSNLLAILQSSMNDITAWMTGKITRTEWNSRTTRKIL